MIEKVIRNAVNMAIKKNKFSYSNALISICNKLNLKINASFFDDENYDGRNVINEAVSCGDFDAVKLFLENGAKLNLDVKNTDSCLNLAIKNKDIQMLEFLIDYIENRSICMESDYDREIVSLLTAKDSTNKSPLMTVVDLFVQSNDREEKETLKKCIELVYNNKLFDKNNSEFYNKLWKDRANYYIEYDKRILDNIEDYVLETKNEELINFFIDNGLKYVNEAVLCVNPQLYTHSGMILKFNEPINFKDSNRDVAGILYSFEPPDKQDNTLRTVTDKVIYYINGFRSVISPVQAYVKRIILSSKDIEKILKKDNCDVVEVKGKDVKRAVVSVYRTLKKLTRTPGFSKIRQNRLQREITANIEEMAYLFSLYTKDTTNNLVKDRITSYEFKRGIPNLMINNNENEGYSIYDFIWKTPNELNLNHKQKMMIVEKFIDMQCLSVLKENGIVDKDSNYFDVENFENLPSKMPNDLNDKYYYSYRYTFNISLKPADLSKRNESETALCGHKLINLLEKYNIDIEKYHFLKNNCILTLKRVLAECGYRNLLREVDKKLNICQVRHPLSVIKRLKEMEFHKTKLSVKKE